MKQVNICLGNPFRMKYSWQELCEATVQLFKPSLVKGQKVRAFVALAKPALGPSDVMVYVLPNIDMSVAARHFGEWEEGQREGYTHHSEPCASEVYVETEYVGQRYPPSFVAKKIWHEVGHNKGKLGNKAFHRGAGLRKAAISDRDTLDKDVDVPFMRRVLFSHVRQWTGGFDFG